ncbi:uncharacterized protein A4U43_C07F30940 [Asparagus officinalis]|uniref:Sulfotransferase n=1 Tax=Asparagus officinalis TaxID=4686 RepID=A0A5P1EG52_ASPOF|nr:cytosolic sulfotransferase 17-like [Asparagus officinalis]ONK64878.1 uncharacterized protein A4U43_C07F30940 [Asparagus officinalis]
MANHHPLYSKFFQTKKTEAEVEEELRTYTTHKELISSLPTNKYGLRLYGSFWLTEKNIISILSAQKHLKASPDDVFLSTYLKSGTTWIRALAFAVVNRRKFSFEDHPLLTTHPQEQDIAIHVEGAFSFPQVPDIDDAVNISQRRIYATHTPYSLLPQSVKKSTRVVYVSRDPKDALVSFWHFTNASRPPNAPFTSLEEMFDRFCEGGYLGTIWDHQMEYKEESMKRPESVLFLEYEEMQEKPEECVRRLAEFLGQPFTREEEEEEEAVQKIVSLCSLEFLKELQVSKNGRVYDQWGDYVMKYSSFYRKGKVGDWKVHMSPAMAEKIDRITQQKMGQYDLIDRHQIK